MKRREKEQVVSLDVVIERNATTSKLAAIKLQLVMAAEEGVAPSQK